MKRKLLLALTVLASMMVACASPNTGNGEAGVTGKDDHAVNDHEVAGTEDDGIVNLTVWGEEDNFPMLEGMIEEFKKKYPDTEFEVTLAVQSDSGLRDVLLSNVIEGPDVFHFPDDQLNSLVAGGVLEEIKDASSIKSANTAASVDAASINGKLYAYPMTADNGFFLYYDKKYITEEDVKTLDGLLAACEKAGKKFQMELNSGWYMYAFFGNAGFDFGMNEDGITNHCNWNKTEGKYTGLDITNSIIKLIEHPYFLCDGDGTFITNAKEGTTVAAVSGVWNAIGVKEAWGDDYGACKLPTFECNGDNIQMSSFTGYKMVGVNAYSEEKEWAHKFAEFITNEDNQTVRFVERNQGPSNIKAAESPEVMKVPAIQAVIEQSEFGVLQRVGNSYWGACTDYINSLMADKYDDAQKQELLDKMVEGITALLSN